MKNVIDSGAYFRCETGYWRRLPYIYTGATLLVFAALGVAAWFWLDPVFRYLSANPAVSLALILAALFLYFLVLRPWLRKRNSGAESDAVLPDPPEGAAPPYFLPVLRETEPGSYVGGVLFISHIGLLYRPFSEKHSGLAADLQPLPSVAMRLVPGATGPLGFLFYRKRPRLIEISVPSTSLRVFVPEVETTLACLNAAIGEVRERGEKNSPIPPEDVVS